MTPTAKATIDDLHPDVLTEALRHLDGPSLAAASCASSHFRFLSSNPAIWRDLCLSTWPSLRRPPLLHLIKSHRSFFSDAYPFPSLQPANSPIPTAHIPRELISAVDLYHKGIPIFSRVLESETSTPWFQCSPFRIDAFDRRDPPDDPTISASDLTLSWVAIDPIGLRAVNVSSRRPVSVDRHWYSGETQVRFAIVMDKGSSIETVVTCGGAEGEGQVREVSLTAVDMDGMCLNGRDSMVILGEAMGAVRRGRWMERGEEDVQEKYREYEKRKRERKERKVRREWRLDMCVIAAGVLVFFAFWILVAFR